MPVTPARRDLTVRSRHTLFGLTWSFVNDDDTPFDLTDYTGTLQVRQYEGQAGAALIDLANVTSDIEGVRIYEEEGQVQILIDAATLEALPTDEVEAGDPKTFKYDLVLTSGGSAEQWMFGDFIVYPGVTD